MTLVLGQIAQAVVNFVAIIGLARAETPSQFAFVSLSWLTYATLLNAQRVLFGEQVLINSQVKGIAKDGMELMITASVTFFGVYAVLSFVIFQFAPRFSGFLPVLTLGSVLLVNDALRYANMAESLYRRLLFFDVVCLVGAMSGGLALWLWPDSFAGFLLVGAGVLVSSLGLSRGRKPNWQKFVHHCMKSRGFLSWSLAQTVLVNAVSQVSIFLALPFISAAEFGQLRAVQSLFSPLTTPATALQPAYLRQLARRGVPHALATGRLTAVGAISIFGIVAFVLEQTSPIWVQSALGGEYGGVRSLIFPVVMGFSFVYVGLPAGMYMRIRRLGKESALAQAFAVGVAMVVVIVCAHRYGVVGAAWATSIQAMLSASLAWLVVLRDHRSKTVEVEVCESTK